MSTKAFAELIRDACQKYISDAGSGDTEAPEPTAPADWEAATKVAVFDGGKLADGWASRGTVAKLLPKAGAEGGPGFEVDLDRTGRMSLDFSGSMFKAGDFVGIEFSERGKTAGDAYWVSLFNGLRQVGKPQRVVTQGAYNVRRLAASDFGLSAAQEFNRVVIEGRDQTKRDEIYLDKVAVYQREAAAAPVSDVLPTPEDSTSAEAAGNAPAPATDEQPAPAVEEPAPAVEEQPALDAEQPVLDAEGPGVGESAHNPSGTFEQPTFAMHRATRSKK